MSVRWPVALSAIALLVTALALVWSFCLSIDLSERGREDAIPPLILPPCLISLGLWLTALGFWGRWLWLAATRRP